MTRHQPIHDWVSRVAQAQPDAVAIEYADRVISYGALEGRANQLSQALFAAGIGSEDRVMVLSNDTEVAVTSLLAILKVGAAFVPVDPYLPVRRLNAMQEVAHPKALISHAPCHHLIHQIVPDGPDSEIYLDFDGQTPGDPGDWRPEPNWRAFGTKNVSYPRDPDSLCYIYFTSGSTGTPKGIGGRLNAIDHFIAWEIETLALGPETRVSNLISPAFDAFMRDVFAALCAGGTICAPDDRAAIITPDKLTPWLEERRVTLMHCVPTVFRLTFPGITGAYSLPDLNWVLLSGEPINASDIDTWTGQLGSRVPLINLYGPSETTMTKFAYRISPQDGKRSRIPIGQPMPGARAVLVDPRDRPVPKGAVGEILIRTPYRSLGYFGRPDLTEKVFVPNPFNRGDPDDLVYRTGDMARTLENGDYELIGRRDHQVKIRGQRIELTEIEAALRALSGVRDAVVLVRRDGDADPVLQGYLVTEPKLSILEIKTRLADSLPEVMIPKTFMVLEALPRTVTGKVDRKALTEIDADPRADRPEHVAPVTQTERKLVQIWEGLLKIQPIGTDDHFFHLGGHSILAMQLLARIKQGFGATIPLAALFDTGTLSDLARVIDESQPESTPIARVSRDRPWPLSFTQRRLWFLQHAQSGRAAPHIQVALRIDGPLDLKRLQDALSQVIRRQESLRTGFRLDGQSPVQEVVPDLSLDWEHHSSDAGPGCDTLIAGIAARAFDLASPPLMRAALIRHDQFAHTALLVMHHLIADAWSVQCLFQDLSRAYHRVETLPELPLQVLDVTAFEHATLDQRLPKGLAFWKDCLDEAEPLLLPVDRPRPAMPRFIGARASFEITTTTIASLKALANAHRATLFMALLTGFKSCLLRFSGQTDIILGAPVANRPLTEVESVIGFFANTLALRTDLSGDPDFCDALSRVRRTVINAFTFQDLPFDEIVRHLQPDRDLTQTPLINAAFVMQNVPANEIVVDDLVFHDLATPPGQMQFDLTVELNETENGISGHIDFAEELFDKATVESLIRSFLALLSDAAARPETPLSALEILTAAEAASLTRPPAQRFIVHQTLHQVFAQQAAQNPDAVAAKYKHSQITYGALDARSDQLAYLLQRMGVGPGICVALYLERDLDVLVAILGVLKAGGAYVPVDIATPAERLNFILTDTKAPVVITRSDLVTGLPATKAEIVVLDTDKDTIQTPTGGIVTSVAGPDTLAYVIYTSGSTGTPKGVPITHANVLRLFAATQDLFAPSETDVWTLFHSYAFDFSVWEIWGALLHGGRLVVVPYWQTRSPDAFAELLDSEQVSVLNQTPSAFMQLQQTLSSANRPSPAALRLVIFGGEALDFRQLGPWFDRYGDAGPRLVNMYGITETTVHVTHRTIHRADIGNDCVSVIGQPLADLSLTILDRHGRPVPIGGHGELYVGGGGLAMGYLNRPKLSAERFLPDPFSQDPNARLYRTGDRARRRADGEIEYLGRLDSQVKLRGFRIELGEIEAVLANYPPVAQAKALIHSDKAGHPQLVAYVLRRPGAHLPVNDLRRFAAAYLPDYMVPSAVLTLDNFPLTRNGKLDTAALPVPGSGRKYLPDAYVPPRTGRERDLVQIWQEVLDVERIGIRDNFFALGGDSIRSIRVCALAQEKGIGLLVQHLFRLQTIEALIHNGALSDPSGVSGGAEGDLNLLSGTDAALLPDDVEDAFPLARLQVGMLYHSDLGEGGATYHDVLTYSLRAPFDREAMSRTLQGLARRHRMLRTSFDLSRYSEPMQLVHRNTDIPLQIFDLSDLGAAAQDAEIEAWITAEKLSRRDWSRAPLLDIAIHLRSEDRFDFSMSFHHAILDGWSVASLLSELYENYAALLAGGEPREKPAPRSTYRHFVEIERQAIAATESADFWRRKLSEFECLTLPELPGGDIETTQLRAQEFTQTIPSDVSERLTDVARSLGVTVKSLFLAAHARVLSLLANTDDVTTGIVMHTRLGRPDGERVLGLFLNALPLRVDLKDASWAQIVTRAFEAEVEMLPHRYFPLAVIQANQGGTPLFQTLFNFTHYHVYQDMAASDVIEVLDGKLVEETNFGLTANFSLNAQSGALSLSLLLDRQIFGDPAQIAAIQSYYHAALAQIADDPHALASNAQLIPRPEQARLLALGQGPVRTAPTTPVHLRIAQNCQADHDKTAIKDRSGALSYAELERAVAERAGALSAAGVGQDDLVAIYLARDADMVVSLLALMRLGAAFLPLDSDYPPDRLSYILEDAGHPRILTRQSQGLPHLKGAQINLDAIPTGSQTVHFSSAQGNGRAYVIFTSGTTGQPKGVVVTQNNLANFIDAMTDALPLTAGDRFLAVTGLPFDIAQLELFLPLSQGGTVVIADRDTVRTPEALTALIDVEQVTAMQATPSLWQSLLETGWRPHAGLTLLSGGEPLDRETAQCLTTFGATLFNMFGPTETTIWSAFHRVTPGHAAPPIGRPVANTQLYVLDDEMNPLPEGVPGELWIGGDGVAAGYLNRPDMTKQRFETDPYSDQLGARLYRTGDRVKWLDDGVLAFVGRRDHQVKIRGHRVELGEIEEILVQHPCVGRAVVCLVNKGAEPELVGYYTVPYETRPAADALRLWLQAKLPAVMVPQRFIELDFMPMTPNGKVDRALLPSFADPAGSASRAPTTSARDMVELEVTRLYQDVLVTNRVGIHDRFLSDLGGQSLQAVRLAVRIRETFKSDFRLDTLLQDGTIAQVAQRLRAGNTPSPRQTTVVTLKQDGALPPLFAVHPAVGNVLSYIGLAGHIGPEQPLIGLQAAEARAEDLAQALPNAPDIPELARHYLTEIARAGYGTPRHICGHSFGGLIAFEMACQLAAAGNHLDRLILIDSYLPIVSDGPFGDDPFGDLWLGDTARMLDRYLGRAPAIDEALDLDALPLDQALDHLSERLARAGLMPTDAAREVVSAMVAAQKISEAQARSYRPERFSGEITLIRAEELHDDDAKRVPKHLLTDPAIGWGAHSALPVQIRTVPGDHVSMLTGSNAADLAECLRGLLRSPSALRLGAGTG